MFPVYIMHVAYHVTVFFLPYIVVFGLFVPPFEGSLPVPESPMPIPVCIVRGGVSSNDSFVAILSATDGEACTCSLQFIQ